MSTTAPISVRGSFTGYATNGDLPGWVRVGCAAWALAGANGHAPLAEGQLRTLLGATAPATSKALATARERGWVDATSSARCLVLPGYGGADCVSVHR